MKESQNHEALELANEVGKILLENGAQISRVEDTMQRIARHYGADNGSFFVLSNGIIATGEGYSKAQYIPLRSASLDKVVEVNQISRDVADKNLSLSQLRERLTAIRNMKPKPKWEQILGSAFGAGFFSMIFGGSLYDSLVSFIAGLLLYVFIVYVGNKYLSRIFVNISGGFIAAAICILAYHLGAGDNLGNMIIGAIIPLVPGIPFTNGIRDIANEDYLAGITRLLDAFMIFLCIALGVIFAFLVDGVIMDGIIPLNGMSTDAITAKIWWQLAAAFFGTAAFSILFGTPRKHYLYCGLAGAMGWLVYLSAFRLGCSPAEATVFGAMAVLIVSRIFAVIRRCPVTVYLICGIFPLVPGGGLFWTSYYLVAGQTHLALSSGFLSIKITVAIAFGIVIVEEIMRHLPYMSKSK